MSQRPEHALFQASQRHSNLKQRLTASRIAEILWTTSIWLESVAIVPQLVLLQQMREVPPEPGVSCCIEREASRKPNHVRGQF